MTDVSARRAEFYRPVSVADISSDGLRIDLEADADERRRLADRFDLLALDELVASFTVTRGASGIPVRVAGRLRCCLSQQCVVSLEAVSSVIDEGIDVEFIPVAAESEEDEYFSVEEDDPPEPLLGDEIDLGELVAQHLAVAIDPYPRSPGAEQPDWPGEAPDGPESEDDSPFSALASWQKKRE